MEDEKNCQSTVCADNNCQETKFIHMWPLKPEIKRSSHMWSAKPAILQSDYKKKTSVCDDKNCQSTKYAKSVCDEKNCQSNQCVHV